MRSLSSIIFTLVFAASAYAQNPHGADLKINCASCHNPQGWEIDADYWQTFNPDKANVSKTTGMPIGRDSIRFSHAKTQFPLKGRHATVDCRECHSTLIFAEAKSDCISCHQDMHQQTVGTDCARCHTPANWLVDNIPELHLSNGFPLTGVHTAVSCEQCHTAASTLQFTRIGNDCISCHIKDFNASTSPDHKHAGFSTDCIECHDVFTPDWKTNKVKHDFFPLTLGHEVSDCNKCHTGGNYSATPTSCTACHQQDYNTAQAPNHQTAHFPNDCAQCHTTNPDWMPAAFTMHDATYFPIYSGKHKGQWTQCTDCHTNASNYAEYTCTSCHINPETNDAHTSVNGYVYENTACLACHPTGDADNVFDHANTNFPLTGAHVQANCIECHAAGYAGTPTQCAACHTTDFSQASNPNHVALNLSTDCASCHTTAPGWEPANFPNHNTFHPLNGAHAAIANDCAACHQGNYTNTPNTCNGCHTADFNATTNPNHVAGQFPTNCATCHSETAWVPSMFDHNSVYPLTGAHAAIANDCDACHHGNYNNTPNTCSGCHTTDFNQATNPKHTALNIPTDCAMCHTTAPGWAPASFPIHNNYYALQGAHAAIANDCATCHNGDYNNTPSTCIACHTTDYNQTNNPNHASANFPTDCAACHTQSAWVPSTFDHDAQYFPIYSGKHKGEWSQCVDCHTNPSNYAEYSCTNCHTNPETNNQHNGVNGYSYNNNMCLACHPTGSAGVVFDHNSTAFALTGAHQTTNCIECHATGFAGTPTQCSACHSTEFSQATNPNHLSLNLSTDCATCHTPTTGWAPASFPNHNSVYTLNGAHASIANDCNACHNGNYTNTPNTCNGCHADNYAQTTNPNHVTAQFPTDCASCHSETTWVPSTFDHNSFYPLTGAHASIANDCAACHHGNYTNTPNTCNGCHNPDYLQANNPNHAALGITTDCATCHTTAPGWAPATFPIHSNYYALNGAHAAIATDCATCHNGNYNSTPNTCNGCHNADYTQTTNPNHVASQFPTNCASCHVETAWAPANFDHNSNYPLTGAHAAIANDCAGCHHGNYTNTPNTCNGCHNTDYTQSTNPNHPALNIPTDCATCHTTAPGWEPAAFPIHNNYYTLEGAHAAIANDCATCHNGNYNNTPNTCNGCHNTEYNATTSPNHFSAQFPVECKLCHTQTAWAPSTFDHNVIYPFTGAHAAIANDCNACHHGLYNGTPNTCNGCHNTDFVQTTNPKHQALNFPTDCAMCHTTAPGWEPATFPIHNTYYALNGAHAAIATDCATCHNGNYNNTPNTCNGCHNTEYTQTSNPNHAASQFPTDCALCHTETAWMPSTFDHNTVYPFTGAHVAIASDCNACHHGNFNSTPNTCNGCHNANYAQAANPNHVQLNLPTDCAMCHTTASGWEPASFPIHNTFYALNGAHAAIASDCATCHNGNYNTTPNTCNGCHNPEYTQTTNPNHAASQFPTDCAMCHTETAWTPSTFDHSTVYPFTGAHIAIANDCNACHHGNFNNTPNTCNGCHNANYTQASNPNHAQLNLPTDCAMCHTTAPDWEPASFPIHNTFYALNGAHAAIANNCATCHNGNYNNTPNTCNGCHNPEYTQTTNPNHVTQQFPTDCTTCHSETAWAPSTFDHNAVYPFTGAHIAIANDCNACHNGNYSNTPNTCNGCHNADYSSASNPSHTTLNLPTDCAQCHTTAPGWSPATFPIHNTFYALNGAHATIANDCAVCHNGNYNNTPNTCNGCHNDDYVQTAAPNHVTQQFPINCTQCHSETAWVPSTFNHNTVYPFTGAHIPIANDCNACHQGNYNNTPNTCTSCHISDYNTSLNPKHTVLNLPTDCAICHTTSADWQPATFPIHNSFWPLNGAHATIANNCVSCHNGNYNNTPTTCVGCHLPDYNQTTNPNHQTQQFPTDCTVCHAESSWVPSTFNHSAVYPFTGAHLAIADNCNICHNGNYTNTPNTCNGCHQANYNTTTNPNHTTLNLPTDCAMCHTTAPDWQPATFPIHNNYWALTGAHAAIANDCAACHNGNYNNTPSTCFGCHAAEYNSATNPNHAAAGFPTSCQNCHTTTAWDPSTFNHDQQYFPIYSGKHKNEWSQCVECHTTPNNFTAFSCIACHEHDNPTEMAGHHSGVNGYQYNSAACYNCHPNGQAD